MRGGEAAALASHLPKPQNDAVKLSLFREAIMRDVQVAKPKINPSALIEQVEGDEESIMARRGKPVARLIPEPGTPKSAAEIFREAWSL